MMRKYVTLAVATLTIAAGQTAAKPMQPPAAKPTPPATTYNCLLASNIFAQHETDQQRKALAHEALLFYLGRLDPRTSSSQLKTALKLTADGLKGVNAASLMNACLVELRAKGNMLQAVGQQLQQGK